VNDAHGWPVQEVMYRDMLCSNLARDLGLDARQFWTAAADIRPPDSRRAGGPDISSRACEELRLVVIVGLDATQTARSARRR
jgi:hypothetical protein